MKKQLFLLMLSAVFILAGCDKENGDGGVFTPPTQEQLTQNAYADNENTGGGFSFTTDAPWTATVEEVLPQNQSSMQVKSATRSSGNNVVWLKLYNGNSEAYSGEAGTITLRIEIDQNYTGERREATITIRSGNNTFIVTVIQEGTKQDGSENEPPVKVTKITLDKTTLLLEAGAKATLIATVEPTDATIKSVVWSSSNLEVATVNPVTGEIVAIADGNAVITATSSSNKEVSASCAVTVGNGEPVAPKAFVSRIERVVDFWESIPEDERYDQNATFTFEYDNTNRVISYAVDIRPIHPAHKPNRLVSTIDYSSPDYLTIQDNWKDTGSESYKAMLNEKGFVTECQSSPSAHDVGDRYYNFKLEYNAEDRISRLSYDDYWNTFVYKDGVLSGGTLSDGDETYEKTGMEKYFSDIANDKMNIDLNFILNPGFMAEEPKDADLPGRVGRLGMLRLTGRGMDRFFNIYGGGNDEDANASVGFNGGWPEPNVTEHKSYEDYESESESMPALKYNLNEDGTVQSVEISMPMVKVLKEYDIISSGEYFHPEHPELGYKYVETNHKETVLDSGITTVTFTFTYR
ncbi:Ig-like domain-containing protein [Odoribacter splanchnicus]|jgi:Ig domain protein group 2 domain protein|uniref:Ig-like domain-containing protein n=2 Tax=Bacteroidales TaxID=171549 RepID=UPI000B36F7DE|nr:Ig-like domain-containing protein [Odoribacter splanchnicus]MDB9209757.1 Ig-like domain-containing protein [Odoribacter splanchnicus]MDB9225471.1 Ig-like domain-containing protein [Odoribacter splanchnicus]MDB9236045.1 Ig-like domain-containing protein [Odoribacter splanchnicus]MDB9240347.1 Ig-like domain-containing protein [Odoribacter splanchnicus]MDB9243825.1 Ig-like domain-containing protein [Odoribacter splanchnicus]